MCKQNIFFFEKIFFSIYFQNRSNFVQFSIQFLDFFFMLMQKLVAILFYYFFFLKWLRKAYNSFIKIAKGAIWYVARIWKEKFPLLNNNNKKNHCQKVNLNENKWIKLVVHRLIASLPTIFQFVDDNHAPIPQVFLAFLVHAWIPQHGTINK